MVTQTFDVRRLLIVGISLVFLTGCTPILVSSTPRAVLLTDVGSHNAGEAQQLAERECRKYGRHAIHRPDNKADFNATYECVE